MIQSQVIRIVALDKTKKAFASVQKGMTGILGSVFSLKTALGVVAGATGFGLLVKSQMNAIDALAKTASRIGTTTDALTRLHHAGQLSGVSTETLNMALQRMSRRVAEASKGTGEAQGALRQLGIEATSFNRLSLDDRMLVLADAFQNVESETEQLRLAFKLFDSEGTAVVNMLKGGSGALKDMYEDAELLGLVMEQRSAKGVERANDAITRLFSIGKGLLAQFTAGLAPAVEALTKHFTEMAIEGNKGFGSFKNLGQYLAKEFLLTIANVIDSVGRMANSFLSSFDAIMLGMDKLAGKRTARVIASEIEQVTQAISDAENADGIFDNIASAGDRLRFSLSGIEYYTVEDLQERLKQLNTELASMGDVSEGVQVAGLVEYIRSLAGAIGETSDELGDDDGDGAIGKVNKLGNALDKLKEKYISVSDIMGSTVEKAFNGVTQAITDGITGAKSFADAFKSMAKSVVDSLIKLMVQFYITQPLFDAIKSGISSYTGGGSTTSTATNSYGGSVSAGQPTIVGERGRELFIPNTNGAIVNSDQLQGGSGVVIQQTINVTTGVQQTVKAEIMNLMPQIANSAKQAVADARMRGGSYHKSLVGA